MQATNVICCSFSQLKTNIYFNCAIVYYKYNTTNTRGRTIRLLANPQTTWGTSVDAFKSGLHGYSADNIQKKIIISIPVLVRFLFYFKINRSIGDYLFVVKKFLQSEHYLAVFKKSLSARFREYGAQKTIKSPFRVNLPSLISCFH